MPKVKEENFFITDEFKQVLSPIDFADTFSTTNEQDNIEQVTNLIFRKTPKWIDSLLLLRNMIMSLFNLKTVQPDDYNEKFVEGGYIRFFRIFSVSDSMVILGLDDKHLDFRVVIRNDRSTSYNIKVTTLVKYNKKIGQLYMTVIKPFHKIIVKSMVRNAHRVNKVNTEN